MPRNELFRRGNPSSPTGQVATRSTFRAENQLDIERLEHTPNQCVFVTELGRALDAVVDHENNGSAALA
jgi:hypothetical protein